MRTPLPDSVLNHVRTDLLIAAYNQSKPLGLRINQQDYYFSVPEVNTLPQFAKNTAIYIYPRVATGKTGLGIMRYPRFDISTLDGILPRDSDDLPTEYDTVFDWMYVIRNEFNINLDPADFLDSPLTTDGDGNTYGTLVIKEDSLYFTGSKTFVVPGDGIAPLEVTISDLQVDTV